MSGVGAATEIANLVYAYTERLDLGDFEGMAELFSHATVVMHGSENIPPMVGAESLRDALSTWLRIYPDGTLRTKHVATNLIIEVDEAEGRATCRSYFVCYQQTEELPLQPIIMGRWHDQFEFVDGQWRFTYRDTYSDAFGNVSSHVTSEQSKNLREMDESRLRASDGIA